MTIDDVPTEIETEAERARELARENGETAISGAFDAGRASGLMDTAAIVARLTDGVSGNDGTINPSGVTSLEEAAR